MSTILATTSASFPYHNSFQTPQCELILEYGVCEEHVLLDVKSEERKIEQERNPVPIDKEEEGQEAMDGSFGYNVCVETVAEIDRVDVVTVTSVLSVYIW